MCSRACNRHQKIASEYKAMYHAKGSGLLFQRKSRHHLKQHPWIFSTSLVDVSAIGWYQTQNLSDEQQVCMYPYIYRVTNCTTKSEEVLFLEEVSVNFRTHYFSANVFRFPHSTDHEFFCLKLYYQAKFPQLHSGYLLRCSCPSILRTRTRRIMVSVFSTETSTEASV